MRSSKPPTLAWAADVQPSTLTALCAWPAAPRGAFSAWLRTGSAGGSTALTANGVVGTHRERGRRDLLGESDASALALAALVERLEVLVAELQRRSGGV